MFLLLPVSQAGEVRITIFESANDKSAQPMPARIHLVNAEGKPQRPQNFPSWHDHFVCDGNAALNLPDGTYRYTVERGPEFNAVSGKFQSSVDQPQNIAIRLQRLARSECIGVKGDGRIAPA